MQYLVVTAAVSITFSVCRRKHFTGINVIQWVSGESLVFVCKY